MNVPCTCYMCFPDTEINTNDNMPAIISNRAVVVMCFSVTVCVCLGELARMRGCVGVSV